MNTDSNIELYCGDCKYFAKVEGQEDLCVCLYPDENAPDYLMVVNESAVPCDFYEERKCNR